MRQVLRLPLGWQCAAVAGLEAELMRPPGGLVLRYVLSGAPNGLRLPPAAAPQRTDELWKHTCFEAFLRPASGEAYYEFNLSPSTAWAAYRFESFRRGMASAPGVPTPHIETRISSGGIELTAELNLSRAQDLAQRDWRVGLSAVIEAADGTLSYWALAHPPGRPDFHHADCFALEVPAPQDT